MKIKFSHVFMDHKGKKMGEENNPLTLRDICVESLMYPTQAEFPTLTAQEKVRRHDLAVKIMNNSDNTELQAEECALLKKIIGDRQLPSIVAQAFAVIDGKELPTYNMK